MTYLLVLVLTLLGLYAARRVLVRIALKAMQRHPEYKARMDLLERSYKAEETVIEEAEWFGSTGLPEDVERELPKYMRRRNVSIILRHRLAKISVVQDCRWSAYSPVEKVV